MPDPASAPPIDSSLDDGSQHSVRSSTLAPRNQRPLGQILLEDGAVDPGNLMKAVMLRQRQNSRLGQILLAQGWVTPEALTHALSRQWRTNVLDLKESPADPRLIDSAGAEFCLVNGILPWRRLGGVNWIATARPEAFEALVPLLPKDFGTVRMLLCGEDDVQDAVLSSRRTALARRAEMRVSAEESCRTRDEALVGRAALVLMAAVTIGLWQAPVAVLTLLTAVVTLGLISQTGLKLLAFIASLRDRAETRALRRAMAAGHLVAPEMKAALPTISVLVPLFEESDVAGRLVERLSRLTYPRELTDVLLVIEASDHVTRSALQGAVLPKWMRVIEVPDGPIKTKPRALNYALNFCRGEIVGIWDAEDRPDPDQLHHIARRFHLAPADLGCLQGALGYYNPRTNWLARCFTVEYTAWFRVLLPGIARLGLVVPLGGTTCFFRRSALEDVDAWDAWNVTEDADLGVRLARRGWRTEIIESTTDEEANCHVVPWVKQRSRWLKGFALTWGVHMRRPLKLWRDLGPKRFIGFQVQFLGMLSQYLLAPMLWSFWLLSLGLPHPLLAPFSEVAGGMLAPALFALFLGSETLNLVIGLWAVRGDKHRHLMAWVPTLHFYFPLGCLAGWKAIYEIVVKPFYWDKTTHGIYDAIDTETPAESTAMSGEVALPVLGQIGGRSLSEVAEALPEQPCTQTATASAGDIAQPLPPDRIARAG